MLEKFGCLHAKLVLESFQTAVIFANQKIPRLSDQRFSRALVILIQAAKISVNQTCHVPFVLKTQTDLNNVHEFFVCVHFISDYQLFIEIKFWKTQSCYSVFWLSIRAQLLLNKLNKPQLYKDMNSKKDLATLWYQINSSIRKKWKWTKSINHVSYPQRNWKDVKWLQNAQQSSESFQYPL